MIVDLNFANDYFSYILEGKKWDEFEDTDKTRALGSAEMDIKTLVFKTDIFDNPPTELKEAICLQALYRILNEDLFAHEINNINGVDSIGLTGYSIAQGKVKKIYKGVYKLLSKYLIRSGGLY